ncbi:DUF3784 domain-containing protein [Gracilibacillus sp. D59]|uniref:DUF3784 domain-containing protein n=1 Tax=Gracilibacillus sp. D59 TaxID=3457434 RepID=UPI003FCE4713
MDTGLIIFVIIMGWTLIIYGGITFFIVKKKHNYLISGFSNRPKEEQEYLEQNGYINAMGKLLTYTFYLLAISFVLGLFSVPYGFEISLTLFMIILFAGIIWIQRYEVPHKRKKNYWIIGIVAPVTLILITGLSISGFTENDITVEDGYLVISGMYGEEIPFQDINQVEKINQLPEVIAKTNGFAMTNRLKGEFRMEGYSETVTLFISGDANPYLVIETEKGTIIFNRDTEAEIDRLYQQLQTR